MILSAFSEFIPLSEQCFSVRTNVKLILEYALEGEDARDNLAFPGVLGAITVVEEIWVGGNGRVI